MASFFQLPETAHYWLCNGQVPLALLADSDLALANSDGANSDGLYAADIEVRDGQVLTIVPARMSLEQDLSISGLNAIDLCGGLIWPCFVDMHTHLDKGHIWPRSPNPDGTFQQALEATHDDIALRWQAEDVYRRAEFGLQCSYAHGTQAVRTHLDASGEQAEISLSVFRQLRQVWADRLQLQAVCLVTLDYFLTPAGERLADLVAESGGVLGGVAFMNPNIVRQIDRVFELAIERGLDLDFHTDESLDPADVTLRLVAEAALRYSFTGRLSCGHCCSLSVQSDDEVHKTIELVRAAGVSIVSLPMCNLYLQDRQVGQTPRHRGVTILRELKAAGIRCAIASDNCRDPFFAYGDHDGLEVFVQSARIAHLDHPIGDWPQAITAAPAEMMGLADIGKIRVGSSADFVVFKARSFNELMARRQCDRAVIRKGMQIDTALPDYAELDDLMG